MKAYSPNIMAATLEAAARHNPRGEAVTFGDLRVDRRTLRDRVFRLAQAMRRLGLGPGDKAALLFHNTPAFIETNYAIQVAGGVPVPVNYRFTASEMARQVGHSDARIFFYDGRFSEAAEAAAPSLSGLRAWVRRGDGGMQTALDYEHLVASESPDDPAVPTGPNDLAALIYTGGTTGFPKGVMLTYRAHVEMFAGLLSHVVSRGPGLDLDPASLARIVQAAPLPHLDWLLPLVQTRAMRWLAARPMTLRLLHTLLRAYLSDPRLARLGYGQTLAYFVPSLPFFHDAAYMLLMLAAMVGHIRFVLLPELSFDPAAVLQTIEAEKPFLLANVPSAWSRILSHPDVALRDLSSVRVCISGAGVCNISIKKKLFDVFKGSLLIDMFGQTEMTPLTAFRIDTGPASLKRRSVGKPIVRVRILGESGQDLPAGAVGEIAYRSSTMMKGYYKDRDATTGAMPDGWFRSGDLGFLDEEGELRILDRKRECINTGGEKVYPLEVEEVLQQHPGVELCCVIGVPDPEWGQRLRAVVQLRPGQNPSPEDLIRHARTQLAGYKVPRQVLFVDELPLSPVGKVLRETIRQRFGGERPETPS